MGEQKRVRVKFFRSSSGNEPVREWLKSLSKGDRLLIGGDIKTVEYGWPIGMPVCRPMGNGLFEVRTDLAGNRTARVLFCFYEECVCLLHGFIKKSGKTPQKDLEIALRRRAELEGA
jgi:phage-related protein